MDSPTPLPLVKAIIIAVIAAAKSALLPLLRSIALQKLYALIATLYR